MLWSTWRLSPWPGGNPGGTDSVPFPADPLADANGNGERDLIDYALGNDLRLPEMRPAFTFEPNGQGGAAALLLRCPVSLGAERATIEVLFSSDLAAWQPGAPHLELVSTKHLGDGRALVTWRVKPPLRDESRLFMRLRVTERE